MGKLALLEATQEQHQKKSYIFRLSQFDRSECFNFSTRLKGLTQLVQEKRLLTIEYRAGEPQRPLRPIGLMPLPQGAVLFAECLLTGMNNCIVLSPKFSLVMKCFIN